PLTILLTSLSLINLSKALLYSFIACSNSSPFTFGVVNVKNINSLFSSFLKCSIRILISKLSFNDNLQLHIGQNLFSQKFALCNFLFSNFKSLSNIIKSPQVDTLSCPLLLKNSLM